MTNVDTFEPKIKSEISFETFKQTVLNDYKLVVESRQVSVQGRKIVLSGKAKFGIFGAGKEVAQIALAKAFEKGDWRSGYYRDQTFAFATNMVTYKQYFAQLFSDPRKEKDPHSMGRQMNAHFANKLIDDAGQFLDQTQMHNTAADLAPTASQMPRSVGLALASKLYRSNNKISNAGKFTNNGNEICFATIGDASCAEGLFWETLNAAAVQKIPLCISVWDDGYGISVPAKYQIAKSDISKVIEGFRTKNEADNGIDIYEGKGWDYSGLIQLYQNAAKKIRATHRPALIHIKEVTQPQGHSTSGSHQRYKSTERLQWEKEYDCNLKFRSWILEKNIATEKELEIIEQNAKTHVKEISNISYREYLEPIDKQRNQLVNIISEIAETSIHKTKMLKLQTHIANIDDISRKDVLSAIFKTLKIASNDSQNPSVEILKDWRKELLQKNEKIYSSHLYNETSTSHKHVTHVKPQYNEKIESITGYQILNRFFDISLEKYDNLVAFGEDVGKIGGVNQSLAGLQQKYGEHRIFDTGIREATIIGQAIGLALRGIKPIAEIQYLDYLLYGLQILSDDLASLHYRSAGAQIAPAIIRTRGHRLEGIWHTGSPIGTILHSFRGIHVCVPRNMVQAAGMYNTLLQCNDPALVIERLNAYRLKEEVPSNLGEYTLPLGLSEVILKGNDVTVVSYGSTLPIVVNAAKELEQDGISVEVIDIQTLIPFDVQKIIEESVKKTNRLVVVDEDVPGGASAYILQQLLDEQNIYFYLDASPVTISAKAHRPPFGSDGDYFSKPNKEQIYEEIYKIMHESNPQKYSIFY